MRLCAEKIPRLNRPVGRAILRGSYRDAVKLVLESTQNDNDPAVQRLGDVLTVAEPGFGRPSPRPSPPGLAAGPRRRGSPTGRRFGGTPRSAGAGPRNEGLGVGPK